MIAERTAEQMLGRPWMREFLASDLDPAFRVWFAWALDVYDEDSEAGTDMLLSYVASVMVRAQAA